MPSAIGVPGLFPVTIPATPSPALYTTVVTNDAELIAALTADGGDTFIVAGTYTLDMGTIGALDTTPRRFVGAARTEVIINLEDSVGGNSGPDFSASLTTATGVGFENCSFVNTGANGLLSLLTGCYGVYNCFFDLANLAIFALASSNVVVGCSVDMNTTPSFGAAFSFCNQLTDCSVIRATHDAFSVCEQLENCRVSFQATLAVFAGGNAFDLCQRLTNCEADYSATTTASGATTYAFSDCRDLSSCIATGPSGGAIADLNGFSVCERMSACHATDFITGFELCARMSSCHAEDCTATGYDGCQELAACRATDCASPFFGCSQLSACMANGSLLGTAGYDNCVRMAACTADTTAGEGFLGCLDMAGCFALSNTLDGFSSCQNLSSGRTSGNFGFGYASNDRVSCALGGGDALGLSDGFNTAVDPITAAGI